jgi:outer membrane protein OmpA-like peptidoglycan-associated protein
MKQIITIFILSCLITAGCTTPGKKTAIGAGLGATGGAVLGAAVGSASGNAGKGALIGAATGAVVGGAVGNHLDKQAKELAQYAETRRTEEGIMVNLKGDILFESGKANLKPEAANRLKQIGTILAKYPEDRIVIVGHSDDAGNDAYNLRLSENRANAVKVQLLKEGVPQNSLSTMGMGESQPVTSNATPQGRAQNRRVELSITIPEG